MLLRLHLCDILVAGLGLLLGMAEARAADDFSARQTRREQEFPARIQPLLTKYCFDCHNAKDAQADLDLASADAPRKIIASRKRWLTAVNKLAAKEMPPEDADKQPSDEERKQLVEWLGSLLDDIDCRGAPEPGQVTLRRLNRREYRNTVRDLTGIDYEPARDFPGDDTGYGFDNIGDVMTLPPILMEKYLAAAEAVASQAIDAEGGKIKFEMCIAGKDLEGHGQGHEGNGRILLSDGLAHKTFELPENGEYEVRVLAAQHKAGDEAAKMAVGFDEKPLRTFDVKVEAGEAREFAAQVKLKKGSHKLGVAFLNDFWDPNKSDDRDRNLIVGYVTIRGPLGGKREPSETHKKLVFVQPGGGVTRDEATKQCVSRLASRAFRRPATDAEVQRLTALAMSVHADKGTYEQGIELALQAMLCSPNFLFRSEYDQPGKAGEARALTDFELAARLSYFLWSSMPDDELFRLTTRGKLRSPEVLEQQVRRMLADPRSEALVQNFAGQWLELRSLDIRTPDSEKFPQFNAELRQAMRKETELFFAEIMRSDRSVLELLSADFTYLNEPLAKLYGINDVTGSEFRKVSLDGSQRGGILTQASMLTITSNPNRTSPVKRGKWILENLLGTPPPPPPPNVPVLGEKKGEATGTLRQRLEQHRASAACASCHKSMDPLGFALENYDAIGRWRTTDADAAIDSSGTLPTGESIRGSQELRKLLVDKKKHAFIQCLSEKLMIYALGRGIDYHDQCVVDHVVEATEKDGDKFSRLVIEIVRSDPFMKKGSSRSQP